MVPSGDIPGGVRFRLSDWWRENSRKFRLCWERAITRVHPSNANITLKVEALALPLARQTRSLIFGAKPVLPV